MDGRRRTMDGARWTARCSDSRGVVPPEQPHAQTVTPGSMPADSRESKYIHGRWLMADRSDIAVSAGARAFSWNDVRALGRHGGLPRRCTVMRRYARNRIVQ